MSSLYAHQVKLVLVRMSKTTQLIDSQKKIQYSFNCRQCYQSNIQEGLQSYSVVNSSFNFFFAKFIKIKDYVVLVRSLGRLGQARLSKTQESFFNYVDKRRQVGAVLEMSTLYRSFHIQTTLKEFHHQFQKGQQVGVQ